MLSAYFDAFSGVSGDMTIGAFLDLGLPLGILEEGLAPLGLEGYRLETGIRVRSGITACKFTVLVDGDDEHRHHPHPGGHGGAHAHATEPHSAPGNRTRRAPHAHRAYADIRALLAGAQLRPGVRDRAQRIFRALAVAEGRIHGVPPDEVGFHEVGAIDAIVDVVGAAIGFEHFGVQEVFVSPLPLGSGFARSQHGVIPVPPPATIELLRGFPVRPEDGAIELVTPTGAAILAALATPGPPPVLRPSAIGYGAGDRELADRPNLLRLILGERAAAPSRLEPRRSAQPGSLPLEDQMVVLEANIDDMNPELYEAAIEALFAGGARDVTLSPLMMKKGRPGTLLQVICSPEDRDRLGCLVLAETSTIGVRSYPVSRLTLPRARRTVHTEYGAIAIKDVTLPDGSVRSTPEYDDCRRAARERGAAPWRVYLAAQLAAHAEPTKGEGD